MPPNEPTIGELGRTMTRIERSLNEFMEHVREDYVTKESFAPVRMVAYGLVGAILMAVIGALLSLVL